jgi:hypothetical protein
VGQGEEMVNEKKQQNKNRENEGKDVKEDDKRPKNR